MPNIVYSGFLLFELDQEEYEITLGVYNSFKNKINDVVLDGKTILNSI